MRSVRRYLPFLTVAILLSMCTGCSQHVQNGSTHTFSYSILSAIGLFLGGIAGAVAGWFLRDSRFGIVLMIGGPVASLLFAPGYFLDKVQVDDEKLYIHEGLWIAPTIVDVKFADMNSVSLTQEEKRGRRGRTYTEYFINFNTKTSGEHKVEIDNLVEEAMIPIAEKIKAHGIPVSDLTSG